MADKRPYTKHKTEYWANRHNRPAQAAPVQPIIVQQASAPTRVTPFPDIAYGETNLAVAAAVNGGAADVNYRGRQLNNGLADEGAFQNIRALRSPYYGYNGDRDGGYTGVSDAINLCARAWAGVSVARNAVEVSVEFSSQPLYVKCDNETVRVFFEEWLKAIQISRLKEQFFREYYRSGNVFLYRFDGMFGPSYYGNYQRSFGMKNNRVPIRYDLLNPSNVFVPAGISYPYTYVRLLSTWECERLRNPITEQDKQVYNDLPEEAKTQIKNGRGNQLGIYMNMDPTRLSYSFYHKQDYEPLAIPMLWPVLGDIEWKLALKKMDMALARTIEHAILIVTTGEKPDQYNGGNGINPNNIARLQALFSNQTIGRVLVADYTTQAKWLIPEIQDILGPDKYKIVNDDIKEGLQSILMGEDKFANAQIKAKIFIQRLEGGQNRFLDDFLKVEVKRICDIMNFRTVPEIGFQKINLSDETVMARIITQLGQIGILTAEQVVEAIETGVMPDASEMKRGQEEYKKEREKGLYEPLIGGQKDDGGQGPNGRPAGTSGTKLSTPRSSAPIGTSKGAASDGATRKDAFSMKAYAECLRESQAVAEAVEKALRKKYKIKGEFNASQQTIANSLVKAIVATSPRGKWAEAVATALSKPPAISAEVAVELDDIATTYETDAFDAALLRHCRVKPLAEKLAA